MELSLQIQKSETSCDSKYGQIQNPNVLKLPEERIFHDSVFGWHDDEFAHSCW